MIERCTRQFVLIVARNAKCHSSPILADLCTAETVGQRKDPKEEDDIKLIR
jgi:hypothetical protein